MTDDQLQAEGQLTARAQHLLGTWYMYVTGGIQKSDIDEL
jgi:hypothetical protein